MQALPKGETAGSWYKRRIKMQRVANRTGPESWKASRGTERASSPSRSLSLSLLLAPDRADSAFLSLAQTTRTRTRRVGPNLCTDARCAALAESATQSLVLHILALALVPARDDFRERQACSHCSACCRRG